MMEQAKCKSLKKSTVVSKKVEAVIPPWSSMA